MFRLQGLHCLEGPRDVTGLGLTQGDLAESPRGERGVAPDHIEGLLECPTRLREMAGLPLVASDRGQDQRRRRQVDGMRILNGTLPEPVREPKCGLEVTELGEPDGQLHIRSLLGELEGLDGLDDPVQDLATDLAIPFIQRLGRLEVVP